MLEWVLLPPTGCTPPGVTGSSAVAIRDTVYVFGGSYEAEDGSGLVFSSDLHEYNINSGIWRKRNPSPLQPCARAGHCMVAVSILAKFISRPDMKLEKHTHHFLHPSNENISSSSCMQALLSRDHVSLIFTQQQVIACILDCMAFQVWNHDDAYTGVIVMHVRCVRLVGRCKHMANAFSAYVRVRIYMYIYTYTHVVTWKNSARASFASEFISVCTCMCV
jgi:hypothetical protein